MGKGILDINVGKKAVSSGHAPQAQKHEPRTLPPPSRHEVNAPKATTLMECPTVCGRTGVNAPAAAGGGFVRLSSANVRGKRSGV